MMSTFETTQPWVVYHYGLTHDRWWPLWTSTRLLGRARIGMECAVCGRRETASLRMPRFGRVPLPAGGRHPVRERFLAEHAHPERGAPMSWARPLLNPAAHVAGVDLSALAMRLGLFGGPQEKLTRTVHTTPWQPSDTPGEPAAPTSSTEQEQG